MATLSMPKVLLFVSLLCATGVQLPLSADPLNVFAATFNAGNSAAPHANEPESEPYMADREHILEGSKDAHIIVVGLQEFRDLGELRNAGEGFTEVINQLKAHMDNLNAYFSGAGKNVSTPDRSSLFGPMSDSGFDTHRVVFYSGPICHLASHFNTALYVRVRKESPWVITPISHGTPEGEPTPEGAREPPCVKPAHWPELGCSIDNGEHIELNLAELQKEKHVNECGKVVNLLVLAIKHRETSEKEVARLCVMNTHMSFAGTAEQRMGYIAGAMAEAEAAKCDRVVFLGDFNSRLHCHAEEKSVADDKEEKEESVRSVLHDFCGQGGETCNLLESKQDRDELRQFLTKKSITCHEKKQGTPAVGNTVMKMGYHEPNVPTFFPSYKLVNKAEVKPEKLVNMQTEHEMSCRGQKEGETMCIGNKDGEVKHMPAWTDRILIKGKMLATPAATYERRVVSKGFKTDHGAVVASFAFDMAP